MASRSSGCQMSHHDTMSLRLQHMWKIFTSYNSILQDVRVSGLLVPHPPTPHCPLLSVKKIFKHPWGKIGAEDILIFVEEKNWLWIIVCFFYCYYLYYLYCHFLCLFYLYLVCCQYHVTNVKSFYSVILMQKQTCREGASCEYLQFSYWWFILRYIQISYEL